MAEGTAACQVRHLHVVCSATWLYTMVRPRGASSEHVCGHSQGLAQLAERTTACQMRRWRASCSTSWTWKTLLWRK